VKQLVPVVHAKLFNILESKALSCGRAFLYTPMNPEKDWIFQQYVKEIATKAKPLNSDFLIERGSCCGNGCKNCPYEPSHVKGNTKLQTIYKK
jgi:hypothetical protein